MSVNSWNNTMQRVIAEVEARILAVFPEATFPLAEGALHNKSVLDQLIGSLTI